MTVLFLLLLFGWHSLSAEVLIKDQRLQSHLPWNGSLDIIFRVECSERNWDGTPMDVRLSLSGYDEDLDRRIEMKTITGKGAAGEPVPAGSDYRLTWDAERDYPGFHSSLFSVKITAETLPKRTQYLVIDLSGGPEASSYPWRFSEEGPELSGDSCRASELWLRGIPAGKFMMGSPENETGHTQAEKLHQVILTKLFYIGVFEVTQKQWMLVMKNNPSVYPGEYRPVEGISYDLIRGSGITAGAGWPEYGHQADGDSFMGLLQKKTGLILDLPTEAQWEYACRAGTATALNSGENLQSAFGSSPCLDLLGRYSENQKDGRGGYLEHTRVGSYQPNGWGLYDMHGNVYEWCLDWYEANLGGAAVTDPEGLLQGNGKRVIRGGSWNFSAGYCRSAYRYFCSPDRNNSYGFRVMCIQPRREDQQPE